ncbi:MAG: single-stranded-DNA-specific exonuclease RecJ [Candidatus Aminicenantes bacterium]|nr:single-stranded-DNA-specific exonuclease RecJ [Candidatus Aminicenantes bacterium]
MEKMNETVWLLSSPREEAASLAKEFGLPLPIAHILVNRNIKDTENARKFLFGGLDDLNDPYLFKDMETCVERVRKALVRQEKILIFGDYDVDGILSVVILIKALKTLGGDVDYYIPKRLTEGYGIKKEHIDIARQKGASLVISVDCGIKAVDFINMAVSSGIDVIVTDHHRPGSTLPNAYGILNPVLEEKYPDKNLAGIGVVFKLIQALLNKEGKETQIPHYLKLVSIGTVADVVALKGENRIFVKMGLQALDNVSNPGLIQLLDSCRLRGKKITAGDVGFRIGPRINAAGRLGDTDMAVRLFFSESEDETALIVKELDRLNLERQKVEEQIQNQAMEIIQNRSLHERYRIIILGSENWHRGVIGIVASRLKDYFYRPVILFSLVNGTAFGSGRSISEFSLIECLDTCSSHLLEHGGHQMAAGCVLPQDRMDAFKAAVNDVAEARISAQDLKRKIKIDGQIDFSEINPSFLQGLEFLYPFGVGNSHPIFLTRGARVIRDPKNMKKKHSKFWLQQSGKMFEAVGWRKPDWARSINKDDTIDVVYSFQVSTYLGEEIVSLSLLDIRLSGERG